MKENCSNIPVIIELSDFDGNYEKYEAAIYKAFMDTLANREITFDGMPVRHKFNPAYNEKSCTFWHIISDGIDEQQRTPNLRRCERICWPGYILENCTSNCGKMRIWENERKSKKNVVIWCEPIDYIIILSKRDGYFVFWTSYPVTYEHTRQKLKKEYNEYISKAAQ